MELVNKYLVTYKQYKMLKEELEKMEELFNEMGEDEYTGTMGKVRRVNVKSSEIKAHTRPAYSYYRAYLS